MHQYPRSRGVTLIDTLVGAALLLVMFLGIAGIAQLSISIVTNNKARTGALALANEQMEYIRGLQYEDIGTSGGIPSGNIAPEEGMSFNGVSYTRRTLVRWADAPEDGLGESDENDIITDYKEVRIGVTWMSRGGVREIALVSRVSPVGEETAVSGGTLSFLVVDEDAQPVSSARVDITNASVVPAVSITTFTNTDGRVLFLGAPEGSGYVIAISKTGYGTAGTYDATAENPNPSPGHLTVVQYETTSATFTISPLGSLSVHMETEVGTSTVPASNVTFVVRGSKTVGTDASGAPIHKHNEEYTTDALGSVSIPEIEADTYSVSIDGAAEGYDIQEACAPLPFTVAPAENVSEAISLTSDSAHSLLVSVRDEIGNSLQGASVRLYRDVSYDETIATSACGQAFFASLGEGTVAGGNPYSIAVSAAGHEPYTSVDVNATEASMVSVVLNTQP